MAVLGWLPEQKPHRKEYVPLSPAFKAEMREAARKCEMYNCAVNILAKEKITTGEQTLDYIDKISASLEALRKQRKPLYKKAAKAETDFERLLIHRDISRINDQIRILTKQKKALINVLERSGLMKEMIENEMQMRREARQRLYLPLPDAKKEEKQTESVESRERIYGRVRTCKTDQDDKKEEEISDEPNEPVEPQDHPVRYAYERDDER